MAPCTTCRADRFPRSRNQLQSLAGTSLELEDTLAKLTFAPFVPRVNRLRKWSVDFEEIDDGATRWRFDASFLRSNWTCIWGRGCQGMLPEPAEELGQGCCSIGADLDGEDEARNVGALAATIDPARFQHHAAAAAGCVYADETRTSTRVVDGACIFLNRPGFAGGAGCALHLEAVHAGESPIHWKPSVCWQLPIKVDWEPGEGDTEVATVRRWTRGDWGAEGRDMAWCCTEGDRAYVGDAPVVESLGAELEVVVGTTVYVELRRRLVE
jgi:hypothetical protein